MTRILHFYDEKSLALEQIYGEMQTWCCTKGSRSRSSSGHEAPCMFLILCHVPTYPYLKGSLFGFIQVDQIPGDFYPGE